MIAMKSFGTSAPANVLFEHFGFTKDTVVEKAKLSIRNAQND